MKILNSRPETFKGIAGAYRWYAPERGETCADVLQANGWIGVPVTADKRPRLKGWPHLTDAEFWAAYQRGGWAGAGVLCDCEHGNGLIVIDIDRKGGIDGLESLRRKLGAQVMPETYAVRTPSGGLHLYYSLTEKQRGKFKTCGGDAWGCEGVDVRAAGGMVICAFTRYPCAGKFYGRPYLPCADQSLAPLPAFLAAMLPKRQAEHRRSKSREWHESTLTHDDPRAGKRFEKIKADFYAQAHGGNRNNALLRAAGDAYMLRRYYSVEDLTQALQTMAANAGIWEGSEKDKSRATLKSALEWANAQSPIFFSEVWA